MTGPEKRVLGGANNYFMVSTHYCLSQGTLFLQPTMASKTHFQEGQNTNPKSYDLAPTAGGIFQWATRQSCFSFWNSDHYQAICKKLQLHTSLSCTALVIWRVLTTMAI